MGGQGDEGGENTSFTKKELDEKLKQVDDELKMTEAVRLPARLLHARLLSLSLSPASGSRVTDGLAGARLLSECGLGAFRRKTG
eukprot:COSAG01_NODE_2482_length_7600_cov_16.178110_2_plen_84_part_00